MNALTPVCVGLGDATRRGRRHCRNFETKPVDQAGQLFADIAPRRDDQRFGHGAGGNQNDVFGLEPRDADISLRLVKNDRHQRRGIDHDHSGRPSSP